MLFTDCQLWNSEFRFHDAHLAEYWDRYKREVAPHARLYIFDLAGYGQSPISMKRDDVFCIAGWSDKVFDILAAVERGKSAIDEIRRIVVRRFPLFPRGSGGDTARTTSNEAFGLFCI